uniref:Uncharacterized protein n=1 Tax=Chlorobium chlorochromatii (strain CaD3) TaxID=340177 RepID=Q3AR23_CHLCH
MPKHVAKEFIPSLTNKDNIMQAIEFESTIHNGIIQLPNECQQWNKKLVKVIVLEKTRASIISKPRRMPHPAIAGKGKTIGDLLEPIVNKSDWECLQ